MRKVSLHSYDGPAGLRISDVPEPTVGPGDLLIRTEAAGLTLPLLKTLRGFGQVPLPYSPGGEYLGQVIAVGSEVGDFKVGDRVGGVAFEGVYAELIAAPAALATHVPDGASAGEALAVVRSGLVALAALRIGRVAAGESVLITAAAGGVGHLAVQLAKALGTARVVAAVGSEEKAEFVRGLGADEVVGYEDEAWGEPVDLVIENVGGEVMQRALGALAPFGRMVVNAGAGGSLDAGAVLRGMQTVTGLAMAQLSRHRPDLVESHRAELWDLLADGRLKPACVEYPLSEVVAAGELMERRANLGKVVLMV